MRPMVFYLIQCLEVFCERKDMQALQAVIGLTVVALVLYYFVLKADESSKLIGALSDGYTKTVQTLQGR